MKEYTERDDNFYDFEELTSESYLTITSDISGEIANRKDNITTITLQFEDKKRQIRTTQKELDALKRKLKRLNNEKREIGRHLRQKQRSLNVDTHFLSQLNRAISQPNGRHMVDKQKRKIL